MDVDVYIVYSIHYIWIGPLFRMTDLPRPRTSGHYCRPAPASPRTSSACWGRRWSFSTQSWRTRWPELSLKLYLCSKHNTKHRNLTLKQCRTVKVQSFSQYAPRSLVVRVSFRRPVRVSIMWNLLSYPTTWSEGPAPYLFLSTQTTIIIVGDS